METVKGVVTLRYECSGETGEVKAQADIYGDLAITEALWAQGYRITHVPTGYVLPNRFHKPETARKALLRILPLIDWSFTDPKQVTPEQREKVKAALGGR